MDNYVYIVAGLPELTSGFENTGFDYAAVKESIVELLSEKDQQLVELMEEGFVLRKGRREQEPLHPRVFRFRRSPAQHEGELLGQAPWQER